MDITSDQVQALTAALNRLASAIETMPRTITVQPADYRPPGGYGGTTWGGIGASGGTH